MNTKSIIEIFRGDDSDALGYQTIVGTIHTDLDLAGCKAVFRYLGFFQEFDPIPEDGKLTIVIPAASSIQFPPGLGYASLKIYDIDRKVRTFTNRIPVFVSTKTPCRCGGEFDVEFSPFPELEPLKIFIGPNADDYDLYTGFVMKIIDRASAEKYGLSMIYDDMDSDMGANSGVAASPVAVKAAYDAILGMLADNYYNKEQTDEQIDKLAAYYITSDVQGNPFATHAALVNATTYYSGGSVRVPTRNDYAIVIADETHNNEEWRYIYAENEQGVGQWEPQYAVEGVITFDNTVTPSSANGVKSSGIWSALWGALAALPTGFTSLYDWVVSQLAPKVARTELFPAWTANTAYTTYSLVIHDNAVYKCTTSHTSGAEWDSTKWAVATGAEVLAILLDYLALSNKPQINSVELSGNKTGADVKVLDLDGGTMKYDAEIIFGAQRVGNHAIIISKTGVRKAAATLNGSWQKLWDDLAVVSQIPDVSTKADSSSIAAAFDASKQGGYAIDDVVMYNGVRYRCTVAHTGAWDAAHFVAQTVEAAKADDNAVVHTTGDQQTMSAVLQLLSTLYAESGVESHGDYRLTWTVEGNYAGTLTISQDTISVQLAGEGEPRRYKLQAGGGGTVALLENIAPEFVYGHPYGVDELCTSYNADSSHRGCWLYKCIVATDGSAYPPEINPTHWTPATVEDVLAALRTAIAGKADVSAIPYSLGTPTVIDTASSEVVEGETVYYGAATLANRTANIVQVTAATALDELRITFPAATSGKVRDFGLRVEIGTGSAALAAPALVPVAPTGETIKIENNAAEIPALADGTATAKGVTLLYFSENSPGVFVVKGEQVEEVA